MTTQSPPQKKSDAAGDAGANSVDDPLARPKRSTVTFAVGFTVLLSGCIFAVLLYRALVLPEPTRVLVVRADSSFNGVELSVEGESLGQPRVTHVEALGNYVVPFFLWPGKYTLHVKDPEGKELLKRHFDLTSTETDTIDLTRELPAPPTSNPSTAAS